MIYYKKILSIKIYRSNFKDLNFNMEQEIRLQKAFLILNKMKKHLKQIKMNKKNYKNKFKC